MYRDTPKLAHPGSDERPTTAIFLYFWSISFVVISYLRRAFSRASFSRTRPETPGLHSPSKIAILPDAASYLRAYQFSRAAVCRPVHPSPETSGGSADSVPDAMSLHTRAS